MAFGTPRTDAPIVVDTPVRVRTIAKGLEGTPDVRVFDVQSINDHITKVVDTMEPGETVLGYAYVDKDGANIAVVGKMDFLPGNAKWTVYGTAKWDGDWTAGAAVRWSNKGA
jgi:hypothetical protein